MGEISNFKGTISLKCVEPTRKVCGGPAEGARVAQKAPVPKENYYCAVNCITNSTEQIKQEKSDGCSYTVDVYMFLYLFFFIFDRRNRSRSNIKLMIYV